MPHFRRLQDNHKDLKWLYECALRPTLQPKPLRLWQPLPKEAHPKRQFPD